MKIIAARRKQRGFYLPWSGAGGGGGPTDPYFANTVLLCHADGTNGSTTFTNVVEPLGRGQTISAAGTAAVSTTAPLFGTGALDAGSAGLQSAADSDYALTNSFSVEVACRTSSPSSTMVLIDTRINGDPNKGWVVYASGGVFNVYIAEYGAFTLILSGGTVLTNTYQRVAWTEDNSGGLGDHRLFVDGVSVDTHTQVITLVADVPVRIGYGYDGTVPWVGYIDEVRLTKGVARYVAGYTPDVAAFPDA